MERGEAVKRPASGGGFCRRWTHPAIAAATLYALAASYAAADSNLGWTMKASMPTARTGLAAAAVGGTIYAIGGSNGSSLATVEAYDSATSTWTVKASMPTARAWLAVAVVGGTIYAIGGDDGADLATVEAYDIATNTWTPKASMPTARRGLTAAAVGGTIYAIGGESYLTTVEAYDTAANTWTTKASMSVARGYLSAAVVGGTIYAIGGITSVSMAATVEAYDPASNAWTTKASMPTARDQLAAATVGGTIYVVGGAWGAEKVEAYDHATNTWMTNDPLPTACAGLAAAVVGGTIYAVGGAGGMGYLATVQAGREGFPPVLSWAGGAGGVEPFWGFAGTQVFTFSVKYSSPAGSAPASGYPKVHVLKGGAEFAGSPFAMAFVSGTYSSGAVYAYSTTLPAGTDYWSFFEAQDVEGFVATGPPTVRWYSFFVESPAPDRVRPKLALGGLLVAPNRLDLSSASSKVGIFMRGNPGGVAEVRIYDEAGAFVRKLGVALDAQGFGSVDYRGLDANGNKLNPGVYWALGVGGGVRAKRSFLVLRLRGY